MNRRALLGLPLLLAGCSGADLLNDTVPGGGVTLTHDAYAPGPRGGVDIYRPNDVGFGGAGPGLPLVVFIYGGGWRSGAKEMYGFVGTPLARRGAVVLIPDYRLFPEVAFPTFLEDNAAAVAWAVARAPSLGADPARIFLVGHSAGAYNVAMLTLDPRWLAAAGTTRDRLDGAVGLAGPYDFLPITDGDVIPVFAPGNDGPVTQPVTYVDGRNPSMLLIAGTDDTTVNPRNTTALADRIRAAAGPVQSRFYNGIGHIGLVTAFAPVFQGRAPVLNDVAAFIGARQT